jgi:hypothetical protein
VPATGYQPRLPEQVIESWRYFGYRLAKAESDSHMGRWHAEALLDLPSGTGGTRTRGLVDLAQIGGRGVVRRRV